MTIVILDRFPGPPPPYREWLRDSAEDLVVFTGRAPEALAGYHPAGYTEVRAFPDYDTSVAVERAVIDLAERTAISAVVAAAGADLIRTGSLRDHLGLPGQGRDGAIAFSDPVVTRWLLDRAGIPTVPCGRLLRAADVYRYAHRWGYPVRVRQRRAAGWPVVAMLRNEAEVPAFTANAFTTNLQSVPSLLAEPHVPGERHRVRAGGTHEHARSLAIASAALSALPTSSGYPHQIEMIHTGTGEWLIDSIGCAALDADDHRAAVRAQAGLAPSIREVA